MTHPAPEFSRLINADRLPASGSEENLTARPEERKALAARFDLTELSSLTADLTVMPQPGGTVAVTGAIAADVVQNCVVTLEPIASHLNIEVDVIFVPENLQNTGAGAPHIDDEAEEVDTYANGKIDLGELAAQQLGINLDPYPRKPDAALAKTEFGPAAEKLQPFAALADLAKKQKNGDKTGD